MPKYNSLTIAHFSDLQFGSKNRFCGNDISSLEGGYDTLLKRLVQDLTFLKNTEGLIPDALVLTGDLTETGAKSEFRDCGRFIKGLLSYTQLSPRFVAIIPGNHDINWYSCESYFNKCAAEEKTPEPPFWPKWSNYRTFFRELYKNDTDIQFTQRLPWTLFSYEQLKMVVAGLNSTMKETHRTQDHYGCIEERQLEWFAAAMKDYKAKGSFRLCIVHHNVDRGASDDDENLRDRNHLIRILGPHVNCILHGHTHTAELGWLSPLVPVLSTGSAAVKAPQRPAEVPNQYQIIRFGRTGFARLCRQYAPDRKQWIGDTRASLAGDNWRQRQKLAFKACRAAFDCQPAERTTVNRTSKTRTIDLEHYQVDYSALVVAAESTDNIIAKLFSGFSTLKGVYVHRAQHAIVAAEFGARGIRPSLSVRPKRC